VVRAPLMSSFGTDDKGNISREWTKLFQEWFKKVGTALDDQGNLISEILASTKIQGRSEGIGTTVSKLTNVGQLTNADQVRQTVQHSGGWCRLHSPQTSPTSRKLA
jgi:hypothetical protein